LGLHRGWYRFTRIMTEGSTPGECEFQTLVFCLVRGKEGVLKKRSSQRQKRKRGEVLRLGVGLISRVGCDFMLENTVLYRLCQLMSRKKFTGDKTWKRLWEMKERCDNI